MLFGKVQCPLEIDGSILHVGIEKLIEIGLKWLNIDVLQLESGINGQWLDRDFPLNTNRSRLIQFQGEVHLQWFFEGNLHIFHREIHRRHIHMTGSRKRPILERGLIVP